MQICEAHTVALVYGKFKLSVKWELCWGTLSHFTRQSGIGTFASIVPPKWKDSKPPPEKLEIDIGGNSTLVCDAVGDPAPTFTWYKDGNRIISST